MGVTYMSMDTLSVKSMFKLALSSLCVGSPIAPPEQQPDSQARHTLVTHGAMG